MELRLEAQVGLLVGTLRGIFETVRRIQKGDHDRSGFYDDTGGQVL